ncbi:hypothetical protein KBA01_31150 [Kozakia baliensis]|nr:hypothetical protein [Kozakia baliensis]GEL65829.1 hypothetical protein KBA01_31150 [Kozakia baliensis]
MTLHTTLIFIGSTFFLLLACSFCLAGNMMKRAGRSDQIIFIIVLLSVVCLFQSIVWLIELMQ